MSEPLVIVNQPLRQRTSRTGAVRYTIDVKSEPLIYNLDPKELEQAAATAIAEELRVQVKAISAEAAPTTLRARASAAKAYAAGKPWAVKRYSGGKIGPMAPTGSTRAFNDSGRFAASIVAMAKAGKWVVNVAGNRLNPTQVGSVERVFARLAELVPAFANQRLLLQSANVRKALELGMQSMIAKAPMTYDQLSVARARALMSLAAQTILKAVLAA